jgi:hypothetical protein
MNDNANPRTDVTTSYQDTPTNVLSAGDVDFTYRTSARQRS